MIAEDIVAQLQELQSNLANKISLCVGRSRQHV